MIQACLRPLDAHIVGDHRVAAFPLADPTPSTMLTLTDPAGNDSESSRGNAVAVPGGSHAEESLKCSKQSKVLANPDATRRGPPALQAAQLLKVPGLVNSSAIGFLVSLLSDL